MKSRLLHIAVLFTLLAGYVPVFAQGYKKAMEEHVKWFSSQKEISIKSESVLYAEKLGGKKLDSDTGLIIKTQSCFYSLLMGVESYSDGKYMVSCDWESKQVMCQKLGEKVPMPTNYLAFPEAVFSGEMATESKVGGNVVKYTLNLSQSLPAGIRSVEIWMDLKTHFISKVIYYFETSEQFSDENDMVVKTPVFVVEFSQIKVTEAKKKEVLNLSHYFTLGKGKALLSDYYKKRNYTIDTINF